MRSAGPSRRQGRENGRSNRVGKRVGGGTPQGSSPGGFSAFVPIPNEGGRHRAAPFGVGPWDGARVASQQGPSLRPGQGHCSRGEGTGQSDKTERRRRDHAAARLFDLSCLAQLEIPPVGANSRSVLD